MGPMVVRRGIKVLSGDHRTREMRHWLEWLRRMPRIRREFCRWSHDFDPLHSNEAASVAVLAIAASRAGYLAHTEYVAFKRHVTRGRPFRRGRCDLWVAHVGDQISWAFEFKQHFAAARIRPQTFQRRLDAALADARAVDRDEADRRVGCLLIVPSDTAPRTSQLIRHFDELCSRADLAFRIGGGTGAAWLAFAFVD